ncbi:MAG: insulinase family protein [Bacteroidales bacterium]|nr:insulinase family protein [Bacteroidales bacterium]
MAALNRKSVPLINKVEKMQWNNPEVLHLDNGIPVYLIDAADQDVIKIELIFNAGRFYEQKTLTANFTNKMLKEGTQSQTSHEIAEKIDFYGAHLETSSDKDMASVSLYSLNKHLETTLPVLADVILRPVFPENELQTLKQNRKQQFIINNEKVKYVAKRKFNELIFGASHPYGKMFKEKDFDDIRQNDLLDFHRTYYTAGNCRIIVAGKIPPGFLSLLNQHLGGFDGKAPVNGRFMNEFETGLPSMLKIHVRKKNAVQAALRIGKVLFNKKHPDYIRMKILNTVLGGYFGSRLMTNIREDKGYTYGIGSAVVSMQNSGYFFITSEVGSDVKSDALREIYREIEILQNDLVPGDELELVKNYIMGSVLRSMDGAFAMSENFKGLIEYGMDYSYFDNYIETVRSITPNELRDLAGKYLSLDSLAELTVGN